MDIRHTSQLLSYRKLMLAGLFCLLSHVSASALADPASEDLGTGSPSSAVSGVRVEPLANHEVPEALKNQARQEIEQHGKQGYTDASEEAVSYLGRAVAAAQRSGDGSLRSMEQIAGSLAISPASLSGTDLETAKLLGASTAGAYKKEGWTGLVRVFVAPGLGPVVLEEFDFVAGGGGLVMIKEAVNEDINGYPAILRMKKSLSGKSVTELTWVSDRKIFTMRANPAVNGKKADELVKIAKGISN